METRNHFAPVVVALGDPATLGGIEGPLHDAGYPVVCAPDGEHTLVALEESRPRVLIVELGGDESREVLRAVTDPGQRGSTRVLALAPGRDEVAADGADDVLHRPFAPRELVRRVDRLYSQVEAD